MLLMELILKQLVTLLLGATTIPIQQTIQQQQILFSEGQVMAVIVLLH